MSHVVDLYLAVQINSDNIGQCHEMLMAKFGSAAKTTSFLAVGPGCDQR